MVVLGGWIRELGPHSLGRLHTVWLSQGEAQWHERDLLAEVSQSIVVAIVSTTRTTEALTKRRHARQCVRKEGAPAREGGAWSGGEVGGIVLIARARMHAF